MIDPLRFDFASRPGSAARPGFAYAPRDCARGGGAVPAVTIVTPFFNTGEEFLETARCVLGQSLQQWEWLIVNDGSDDPAALELLARFRDRDPRIRVIDHDRNRGLPAARNTGFREARADYVLLLDSDDLLEPTAAEKWFWFLESHPDLAFVKGYTVGFGAEEYLWTHGFHEGNAFLRENLVAVTSLVRRDVHREVGGFDETFRTGLEDWDFWLRCASRGYWGGTVPEFFDWYRRRQSHADRWGELTKARIAEFALGIADRYPRLDEKSFPAPRRRWHMPNEPVSDSLPCENRLDKRGRRLLLIVPWLTMGGADRFNLDMISRLRCRGWEVTVATTLDGDHSWMPEFLRLTPDVFALHNFLRVPDFPRFIRYLIRSRDVDAVLLSNSEAGYLLLPYLRAHFPEIPFLDLCHMEEEEWKNGGYPRLAVEYQDLLDLNVVTSEHLKSWICARGGAPDRVEVCYTNVDPDGWTPAPIRRARVRTELGVLDDTPVILYAARLCAQKQPRVFAGTIRELARRGERFVAVVAGDGTDAGWLRRFVRRHDLEERVLFLGGVPPDRMKEILQAADLFFLPSRWEGIALSLFEALASGVPVVGANVGGQRELVTPECGILIERGDEATEVAAYTEAILSLLRDPERLRRMGLAGRERVANHFHLDQMGARIEDLIDRAAELNRQRARPSLADAARPLAFQAVEQIRLLQLAETLWAERERFRFLIRLRSAVLGLVQRIRDRAVRKGWTGILFWRARVRPALPR